MLMNQTPPFTFPSIWFDAVRLVLAGYLLRAAWGKLRHRANFRTGLAAYHLLHIWYLVKLN